MAENISKNARTQKDKTQKFFHTQGGCGGEIKMIRVFQHGRLQMKARCEKCSTEKRSPSEFKAV